MHKYKNIYSEQSQNLYEQVESNKYMNILYAKPQRSSFDKGLLGTIKYKLKEHTYRKNIIIPLYNELLNTSPSFDVMYTYSDFIRLLERVFFYKNAMLKNDEEKYDKLVSDSELNNLKKVLILDLGNDDVFITFTMDYRDEDEVIEIKVKYNFGKKASQTYVVVNREVNYDSIHSENLMITILERLQKAMAKLFLDYYNKI